MDGVQSYRSDVDRDIIVEEPRKGEETIHAKNYLPKAKKKERLGGCPDPKIEERRELTGKNAKGEKKLHTGE